MCGMAGRVLVSKEQIVAALCERRFQRSQTAATAKSGHCRIAGSTDFSEVAQREIATRGFGMGRRIPIAQRFQPAS
jgi:hypothetical protein